jgi:hypothetical protein
VTSDCPSSEILAAFIEHALTPEEQAAVERHLVSCRICRATIKAALLAESVSDKESS